MIEERQIRQLPLLASAAAALFALGLIGCGPELATASPEAPTLTVILPTPTTPTASPPPSSTPDPTFTPTLVALPTFSPRVGEIAFTSDRAGQHDIYLMNSDGSTIRRLTENGRANFDPAWSPNGEQIAFTSVNRAAEGMVLSVEIFVMEADGSEQRSLTASLSSQGLGASEPVWSPDGSRVAFTGGYTLAQIGEGFNTSQVYLIDSDGLNLVQITQMPSGNAGCSIPRWLPDGRRLLMYCQSLMQGGLLLYDLDTGTFREDSLDGWGFNPIVSPSGEQAACLCGGSGLLLFFETAALGEAALDLLPSADDLPVRPSGIAWSPTQVFLSIEKGTR